MKDLGAIIPCFTFFVVLLFILLVVAPYKLCKKQWQENEKYKEQSQKLREALKSKNSKQISVENNEQYSAELLYIANEVKIILANVGDKLDELLTTKAAKYLVLRAIYKNNVGDNNVTRYFKGRNRAFFNFVNWLEGPLHKPEGLDDNSIGKYCTILFLIYDRYIPGRELYNRIAFEALEITTNHFSDDSPFFTLFFVSEKPQYLDIIKNCRNPPQNRTEIIGRIKEYLSRINAYLEAEGLFEEEDKRK